MNESKPYYDIVRRKEVQDDARKLRRKFLRYKEAEVVYSITHRKLLDLCREAGAIYRFEGYVLINRDIFEAYLEKFHEPSTLQVGQDEEEEAEE